jgi:serine/threonine-protein kinase
VLPFTGLTSLYVTTRDRVLKLAAGSSTQLRLTGFLDAAGVAVDSAGNVYVADSGAGRVVKLSVQ